MRRFWIAASLVAAPLLGGCSDATAPHPLVVEIRTVDFSSPAERDAWPTTPTVEGGTTIRVRGSAYVGCAGPTATGVRRGKRIDVAIEGNADVFCLATLVTASPAFEATVSGLDPGEYLVHVTVAGLSGSADWVVTVLDGGPVLSLSRRP